MKAFHGVADVDPHALGDGLDPEAFMDRVANGRRVTKAKGMMRPGSNYGARAVSLILASRPVDQLTALCVRDVGVMDFLIKPRISEPTLREATAAYVEMKGKSDSTKFTRPRSTASI